MVTRSHIPTNSFNPRTSQLGFKSAWPLWLMGLFLCHCGSDSDPLPDAEDLVITKLTQTQAFWLPTSGQFLIRDKQVYQDLVDAYWLDQTPPPAIDFEQDMLIGVFYGGHHSGCQNQVQVIDSVQYSFGSIRITVSELPDLGPCDAIIAPHQFITVPKRSGPFSFSGPAPAIEAKPIDFTLLADFENFFVITPGIQLFRDQQAWLTLWETTWIESDANGRTPPPEVDFSQDMVLAVFYGQGFSGCDQRVELVEEIAETCPVACDDNRLRIRLRSLPEDLGGCRQALAPLTMVVLPQSDLNLLVEGPRPN